MRRYLVVSNQTLGGAALAAKVKAALEEGPAEFHLVVPATAPSHFAWSEGEARAVAQERLDGALRWFTSAGATATGEVADEHPLYAIRDALREQEIDEIIISTLPPGASKWLRQDLPRKARKEFGIPVTHVVGDAAHKTKTA
jgi:GABA permease